jgi:ubiquinol-cytochrome c reductase cytochrome c1 subunit
MKTTGLISRAACAIIVSLGMLAGAHAAGGGIHWDKAPDKTNDLVSLQNGAKLFVNYCLN